MEWRGFKERVRAALVFIQKFPFATFLLFLVLLLAISNVAGFLTQLAVFVTICEIALVNFGLFQVKKMRPTSEIVLSEIQDIAAQAVVVHTEVSDCSSSDNFSIEQGMKSAVHWFDWARRFQGLVNWALELVERQILLDIDEEGLVAGIDLEGCDSAAVTEDIDEGAVLNSSKRETTTKIESLEDNNGKSSKDAGLAGDNIMNVISNSSHHDGDETDVPELEECSSSGEDEVICKTVLESTCFARTNFKTKEDGGMDIKILEPPSKAAVRPICVDDDANSVDKYQILPPELCGKTLLGSNTASMQMLESPDSIAKGVNDLAARLDQLTDAGDFYTLEGDVLWHDTDVRKLQDAKRLDVFRPTSKRYQVSEPQDHEFSLDDYTIYPCEMQQSQVDTVELSVPSNARDDQADSNALDKKVRSVFESTEIHGSSKADINEDVLIDQELRAIAFGRLKRGEDPAFVSSTTSFREFEECWPEFGAYSISLTDPCIGKVHNGRNSSLLGVKEPEITGTSFVGAGCCDQPRVCIAHSRSRSKILQSDPLLSSESLIREQEMDVLWQQYDEDSAGKSNVVKQRIKTQGHPAVKQGGMTIGEKILDGNLQAATNLSPISSEDPSSGNASSCVDGCWQVAYKTRRFPRRKYFVGICKVLKELGLKQCIQSSKVKN